MDNTVVLYGTPPVDMSPRIADTSPRIPDAPDSFRPLLPIFPDTGALLPCTICKRHIRTGTECPFCFAAALAVANKPPTRAAADLALRKANTALVDADRAIAALSTARTQLCAVVQALEEACK